VVRLVGDDRDETPATKTGQMTAMSLRWPGPLGYGVFITIPSPGRSASKSSSPSRWRTTACVVPRCTGVAISLCATTLPAAS
jgi:hypothetical protein